MGWPLKSKRRHNTSFESSGPETEVIDLEEAAMDQIAQLIMALFKGHGLTRLVDGIFNAQGYITYRSPEDADAGADILAGAGQLEFGEPRLCVQVKSEQSD